jgi:NAD(P)-dependent dehydrogenase (short-subunit alcohol dehydrogenase family)
MAATASSLSGHVAVVTGASSGVGRAIALHLARAGATVCLVGRRAEALEDAARDARSSTPGAFVYRTDLANDAEMATLARDLRRDVGTVDVLVHAAGVIALGSIEEATAEEFDRQFRTNVRAPYVLTQALLPLLRSRRGQVVFLNSSAGLAGRGGAGQYAATKHALRAVADSLRDEVNRDGIRVLSVFLGRTATPMQAAVHQAEAKPYDPERLIRPEDVAAIVLSVLSLPRSVEVTDVTLRPMSPPPR